jgi:hypothetical protein
MAAALSTLDLSEYLERVRAFLVDAGEVSYSDESLEEALRQACGDLGRSYGAFVTIEDLDSADATSVELADEDLSGRGAAGYAARMRAVDRADSANLGQNMPANLLDWSKNTLYYFDQRMREVKQRLMQQSTNNPAGEWTWDESDKNW